MKIIKTVQSEDDTKKFSLGSFIVGLTNALSSLTLSKRLEMRFHVTKKKKRAVEKQSKFNPNECKYEYNEKIEHHRWCNYWKIIF